MIKACLAKKKDNNRASFLDVVRAAGTTSK